MGLRVKNLIQKRSDEDLYNPIELNHIFNDGDILDEWIREGSKNLFYHPIIWIGWIKIFPLKKVEKQLVMMMVAQVTGKVGLEAVLSKEETLVLLVKVRLLE